VFGDEYKQQKQQDVHTQDQLKRTRKAKRKSMVHVFRSVAFEGPLTSRDLKGHVAESSGAELVKAVVERVAEAVVQAAAEAAATGAPKRVGSVEPQASVRPRRGAQRLNG
jgi:hypothetical protein